MNGSQLFWTFYSLNCYSYSIKFKKFTPSTRQVEENDPAWFLYTFLVFWTYCAPPIVTRWQWAPTAAVIAEVRKLWHLLLPIMLKKRLRKILKWLYADFKHLLRQVRNGPSQTRTALRSCWPSGSDPPSCLFRPSTIEDCCTSPSVFDLRYCAALKCIILNGF